MTRCPQEFLLPNFCHGFIFEQFQNKWDGFVQYVYVAYLLVLAAHTTFSSLIAAPSFLIPDGPHGVNAPHADLGTHTWALVVELVLASFLALLELFEQVMSLSKASATSQPGPLVCHQRCCCCRRRRRRRHCCCWPF